MALIPIIIRRLYAGRLNQIDDFRKTLLMSSKKSCQISWPLPLRLTWAGGTVFPQSVQLQLSSRGFP